MDIQKLKYDLSMQCALVDVLKERAESNNSSTYDLRSAMMDKFKSYYQYYSMLDSSKWDPFKELG